MDPAMESKVRCLAAITTLLQNAVEIGQAQIAKEGVLQIMLEMAKSSDYVEQLVACEAIIAATQKKKDSAQNHSRRNRYPQTTLPIRQR